MTFRPLARLHDDWKWYAALAALALFAAFVALRPLPDPRPPPEPPAPGSAESGPAPAPGPTPPESGLESEWLHYTVQKGDTVAGIAHLFVVAENDLRRANGLLPREALEPGRKIRIPPSVSE